MSKLWSRSIVVAAVVAAATLAVAGIAVAAKWERFVVGDLEVQYNGGFSPKRLSKTKPTPITFNAAAKIASLDEEEPHPPALKEVLIEGDKHGSVSVKGYPPCTGGRLQSRDSRSAEIACPESIVGTGTTSVEIEFPEQQPIPVRSKLIAFSGGVKGGVTTLYIHAYITVPTPAAIVTTVKIKKVHKGRYGLESVATIPKIAGGSGSVTFFTLTLKKGVVSATCADGHLDVRGTAIFADGARVKGSVTRPCAPQG